MERTLLFPEKAANRCSKIWILAILVLLLPGVLSAYDFSDAREDMIETLKSREEEPWQIKMAIVFHTSSREAIKKKFYLIDLKRRLARQMASDFAVADPLIVQQIIENNKIDLKQLQQNSILQAGLLERAESNHLLFAHFFPKGDELVAKLTLFGKNGEQKFQVEVLFSEQSTELAQAESEVEQSEDMAAEEEVYVESFIDDYDAPLFSEQVNDSWLYFSPTALQNPDLHFLEFGAWLKHLTNSDLPIVKTRYDFTIEQQLSLGVYATWLEKGKNHSSYSYAKMRLFDLDSMTTSIGVRRRLHWNRDNEEFNSGDEDLDDKNLNRNKLTLQLMVTSHLENLGLLVNGYLDNQTLGLGAKLLLISEIRFFVDSIYNYYDGALDKNDQALGFEFNTMAGFVTKLSYQSENEQSQLIIGYSW